MIFYSEALTMTNDEMTQLGQVIADAIRPRARKDTGPTHEQLATEYLATLGNVTRYHQKVFLVYDDTHYREETELAAKVRRFLIRKGVAHNNFVVSNVVNDILAMRLLEEELAPSLPYYTGRDVFPRNIIPFRNGLLDLDAYLAGNDTLKDHTHKWVSTFCLPYDFDPSAKCPLWLDKLDEVFKSDRRADLLQEWYGYTMTPDMSQQKFLIKVGPPRAFKGTSDRVHEGLIGAENTVGFDLRSLARPFGLRRLVGKHVAFVGEVELTQCVDKVAIIEKLKQITGGDKVSVESKGINETPSMYLPTRFSVSCNEQPRFIDTTGALAARALYINFDASFVGREDKELASKLLGELPGIANWALAGLRRLRANGRFTETEQQKEIEVECRRNACAFAFLQDCLQVERGKNPGNLDGITLVDTPQQVSAPILRKEYELWTERECRQPLNGNMLEHAIKAMIPTLGSDRRNVMEDGKTRKVTTYYGIGLAL
jgi:P4 family phage/plasmid primase-like protien